jgi:hypothetical protein
MHVGRRDRGGIVFQVLLDHAVSSVRSGRGDDGRSSTGAGVRADAASDLEDANLPPVPPVDESTNVRTGGTGGKTQNLHVRYAFWD